MNPNVIGGNPAVRRVVKGSRSAGDEASEEQFATHVDTVQHDSTDSWNEKRHGRRRDGFSSKESSQNSFSVDPGPVAFGYWKESDAGLRRYAVRISKQCEEHVCQPDVKVVFDGAGEFRAHYNGETLDWSLKITNNETTRREKTGVPTRRHKSKKSVTERVIRKCSTNPRETRSRVVTRDNIAGVSARASVQNDVQGSHASTCVI